MESKLYLLFEDTSPQSYESWPVLMGFVLTEDDANRWANKEPFSRSWMVPEQVEIDDKGFLRRKVSS